MSDPVAEPVAEPAAAPAAEPTSILGSEPTGGTAPDFRSMIPEEFRDEPCLANIKDMEGLTKSFVSGQKLIGKEKVVRPGEKSTPEEWNEYWKAGGRPDDAGDYQFEQKEGRELQLDEEKVTDFKRVSHELGLSGKQASALMDHYLDLTEGTVKQHNDQQATERDAGIEELRGEWKGKFDENVELAQRAVRTYGGEDTMKFLDASGLGDNPAMVRMMAEIGRTIQEDGAAGAGKGLLATKGQAAASEISTLTRDSEFMAALNSKSNPGHDHAVQRWSELHGLAHG